MVRQFLSLKSVHIRGKIIALLQAESPIALGCFKFRRSPSPSTQTKQQKHCRAGGTFLPVRWPTAPRPWAKPKSNSAAILPSFGPGNPSPAVGLYPVGQWAGVYRQGSPGVVRPDRGKDAVPRTRQPLGERLQRELQRETTGISCSTGRSALP